MTKTIAGHENAETAIIDKGKDHDSGYRYYLVGMDGHEFPIWPDEIGHYRDLLDEFEAHSNPSQHNSTGESSDATGSSERHMGKKTKER